MAMHPNEMSEATRAMCAKAPVVPVLVVEAPDHAKPLAQALIKGGLPMLEVTLRTQAALEVISEMATVGGGIVGAGTLITPQDVANAVEAGAKFGVSPGATDRLIDAAAEAGLPLLPGAVTASEILCLMERGFSMLKFFPAEGAGGAAALRSFSSPLPQVSFCPTGGIGPENVNDYLALPNVVCVGGSWVASRDLVCKGDWAGVTSRAREAAALG